MKLVFFISSLSSGGAERVMSYLVNALCERHDVTLISLKNEVFYPLNPKVKFIVLGSPEKNFVAMIRRLYGLRKLFKSLNPDVMISFMTEINVIALFASLGLSIPIIISERINPCHPVQAIFNYLKKILYHNARFIVYLHKDFIEPFGNDIVIFNPVPFIPDPKIHHKKIAENLIAVGRLNPQKDHETLIHAMKDVVQKFPQVTLNIYGTGTLKERLEKLIHALHLTRHIFLCGTTQDMLATLKSHDLFVFPSLYEGFPNALAEAMSAGLPVVSTYIKGNIVPYECVPIQDPKALSQRICDLIKDQTERERLGEMGRIEMQNYNLEKMIALWEETIMKAKHV
jgi:GalNAc-alpha-(1->4)-GalNAc-alpha-(1->3)-diNAcBac-PP-undecaprenol alpha-1,4-N-acetyl-D-galactosaminyltransferase